jgi:hypothetical protein
MNVSAEPVLSNLKTMVRSWITHNERVDEQHESVSRFCALDASCKGFGAQNLAEGGGKLDETFAEETRWQAVDVNVWRLLLNICGDFDLSLAIF